MASYLRPETLDEALTALAESPRVIVAGATDHYPSRVGSLPDEDVLDITAIDGLRGITRMGTGWRIPARATWTDVVSAELPPAFDGLKAAARTIGGVQIQNRATVCGNVCNASPAADSLPNLIALDAEIELTSVGGTRRLPVTDFVTGNRSTRRRPDELVTAIHIPDRPRETRAAFAKLGSRSSLVISIVMVAAVIDLDDHGRITGAGVSVGACSPVAVRLPAVESGLIGRLAGAGLTIGINAADLDPIAPIDDIRGSAAYRREAALVLVRRTIDGLTA